MEHNVDLVYVLKPVRRKGFTRRVSLELGFADYESALYYFQNNQFPKGTVYVVIMEFPTGKVLFRHLFNI